MSDAAKNRQGEPRSVQLRRTDSTVFEATNERIKARTGRDLLLAILTGLVLGALVLASQCRAQIDRTMPWTENRVWADIIRKAA